jgi:hypothetical protein
MHMPMEIALLLLIISSWYAKAYHPRVRLVQSRSVVRALGLWKQIRGWSAYADHDDRAI